MRGGPRLAGLPSSQHAVNRRLRLPDLRTGEDPPLSTTFRRSNRKICRSQWLSTPRRPRSDHNATFPTRSPRSIASWPSRLQRPFIDASVAPVAFRGTSDGIYDAVVLANHTLESNAARIGAFLGRTRSAFERPPASVRNPDASHLDLSVTHSHGFAMSCSEPVRDQVREHADAEAMVEQVRSGTAVLPCVGEQFECTPLFCAELMFLKQNAHRIFLRETPHRGDEMIPFSRIVQGRVGILRS